MEIRYEIFHIVTPHQGGFEFSGAHYFTGLTQADKDALPLTQDDNMKDDKAVLAISKTMPTDDLQAFIDWMEVRKTIYEDAVKTKVKPTPIILLVGGVVKATLTKLEDL